MSETQDTSAAPQSVRLLRIEPDCTVRMLAKRRDRAVSAGFDGIEWPLDKAASAATPELNAACEDLIREADRAQPLAGALAAHCSEVDVDRATEQVTALLSGASLLGAGCLNLTLPPVSRGIGDGFARYQEALNFAYQLLRRARFDAEAAGVAVALDAGAGGLFLSPVELRDLIDAVNSWAVGACVDVGRVERIGLAEDWLITLRHRVQSVRFPSESRTGTREGTLEADSAAIQAILGEITFKGPIIVEGGRA